MSQRKVLILWMSRCSLSPANEVGHFSCCAIPTLLYSRMFFNLPFLMFLNPSHSNNSKFFPSESGPHTLQWNEKKDHGSDFKNAETQIRVGLGSQLRHIPSRLVVFIVPFKLRGVPRFQWRPILILETWFTWRNTSIVRSLFEGILEQK